MDLRLTRVDTGSRVILERLLQLSLYEGGMEPGPDGLIDWGEPLDKFLTDPACVPLFFTVEGRLAGFALVKLDRRPTGPDGKTPVSANFIEEFYVMRPHRRKGIGTRAADLILRQYPGRWMVSTWPGRVAVRFWHHVATGRADVNGVEFGPGDWV